MKKNVLVTDSLFIFDEHIRDFDAQGITVTRLDKPMASEEELIEAIKGKHGYILGGIEKITARIIEEADCLEAIAFTGTDWLSYIPGHSEATNKNIAVSNCPGANANAVAEFALTLILAMQRNIFELGRTGKKSFQTTNSLLNSHVGIVGMGTIGAIVAKMLKGIGVKKVSYYSQQRKSVLEERWEIEYLPLNELLQACDVVSLHTSKAAGEGYIGADQLAKMKSGSLLVDTSFHGAVQPAALLAELKSGRLRAAADHLPAEEFRELPEGIFYFSNQSTAYNTHDANKIASDIATASMINMLQGKPDKFVVNSK